MRSLFIILIAGTTLGLSACGDDANKTDAASGDTTTTTTTTTDAGYQTSTDVDVPVATRTTFETKYPKATKVKWTRYKRAEDEQVEAADWNYNLDTSDYEVSFNWNDLDYMAWYDDGRLLRITASGKESELPTAVNSTIKKEFPGFTIHEVDKEFKDDGTTVNLYEVELLKGDEKWKAHFTPEGKMTKKKKKLTI